jgi:hypothetical protein
MEQRQARGVVAVAVAGTAEEAVIGKELEKEEEKVPALEAGTAIAAEARAETGTGQRQEQGAEAEAGTKTGAVTGARTMDMRKKLGVWLTGVTLHAMGDAYEGTIAAVEDREIFDRFKREAAVETVIRFSDGKLLVVNRRMQLALMD